MLRSCRNAVDRDTPARFAIASICSASGLHTSSSASAARISRSFTLPSLPTVPIAIMWSRQTYRTQCRLRKFPCICSIESCAAAVAEAAVPFMICGLIHRPRRRRGPAQYVTRAEILGKMSGCGSRVPEELRQAGISGWGGCAQSDQLDPVRHHRAGCAHRFSCDHHARL